MSGFISYDLLREPWIPCERPDGSRVLVGIEEALVGAHTFATLHDESPLVTATLHRLLLAILQRVFHPETMEDWVLLWEARAFDASKVRAYLAQWKHRFDLFHPERPFLQVANLREVLLKERGKEPEATEAWFLAPESSRHSGPANLFEPLPPAPSLDPACAARSLLAFLGFTAGGRIQNEAESWKSGALRSGAVVLLLGDNLHRTLVCNLIWERARRADDVPPWEREKPTQRVVRAPHGFVDLLVWPARRVLLLGESDERGQISIREVLTAAGERLDTDVPDPMFGYVVRDPKKPPFPIRIAPDRSVWRDAAALFDTATGSEAFRRPLACERMAVLVNEGLMARGARFQVQLLGLASDQAAIDLWRADRMPLPASILNDGPKIATLRAALSLAEDLGRLIESDVLRVLAENALAPGNREAHKDGIRALKRALGVMPSYWAALGQAFAPWLDALGVADDLDPLLAGWKDNLRETARAVVESAELSLGTGARALQAGAKARHSLVRALQELLGDEPRTEVATATPSMEGASL